MEHARGMRGERGTHGEAEVAHPDWGNFHAGPMIDGRMMVSCIPCCLA